MNAKCEVLCCSPSALKEKQKPNLSNEFVHIVGTGFSRKVVFGNVWCRSCFENSVTTSTSFHKAMNTVLII